MWGLSPCFSGSQRYTENFLILFSFTGSGAAAAAVLWHRTCRGKWQEGDAMCVGKYISILPILMNKHFFSPAPPLPSICNCLLNLLLIILLQFSISFSSSLSLFLSFHQSYLLYFDFFAFSSSDFIVFLLLYTALPFLSTLVSPTFVSISSYTS